ncbi:MAG: hypothetical protein HKN41_04085 [Ilumatobacter sp.]|nr:hypothetical protein [Ilumatobacter sp.]
MTAAIDDLRPLADHEGPFLTILLPAPSRHADAAERFAIRCKNALKGVSSAWPADDVEALEKELLALPHDAGAGVIVIRASDGTTLTEFVDDPLEPAVFEGPFPRLAPLIESRQRTVPHVLVDADKAGADLIAFDGGQVIGTGVVEGETEHIHRGHPGGWSQRRFQQRAENTWEHNADDVADGAAEMARSVGARLVAVAGPPRANSMVTEALQERLHGIDVHSIEAGDADGIADEVTRLTADLAASDSKELIERARESMATNDDFDGDVIAALRAGRVETLLVHDDGDTTADDRRVDQSIRQALATGAAIHVVPNVTVLDDGVAAVLRW